jgi:hypothetical protein
MNTYYTERANGQNEYWTYCDGRKVYVSAALVQRHVAAKTARLINVK